MSETWRAFGEMHDHSNFQGEKIYNGEGARAVGQGQQARGFLNCPVER